MRRHSRKQSVPFVRHSSLSSFDMSKLEMKDFEGVFENLNDWTFDVFRVEQASANNTLNIVTYKILAAHGLIDELHLNEQKLMNLLTKIEKGYLRTNPC